MAFNIDIEVLTNNGPKYRLFCASGMHTWEIEKSPDEIIQLATALKNEKTFQGRYIPVLSDIKNVEDVENFLNQLGCTSAILRWNIFQDFINPPKDVRDALPYVSDKPFGKMIKEGNLNKHPTYVQRSPLKKWFKLTSEAPMNEKDRGTGTLLLFANENDKEHIVAFLKITGSTELAEIKELQNGLLLKSGKRQWVLQSNSNRDYTMWMSALRQILKQVGAIEKKIEEAPKIKTGTSLIGSLISNNNNNKDDEKTLLNNNLNQHELEMEQQSKDARSLNYTLKQQLEQLRSKTNLLEIEINNVKGEIASLQQSEDKLKIDIRHKNDDKVVEAQKVWENDHEIIRRELEELHQQLEDKAAKEGFLHSAGGLLDGFKEEGDEVDIDKDEEDEEHKVPSNKPANGNTNVPVSSISEGNTLSLSKAPEIDDTHTSVKFTHKHLHKHDHKHICHHKHTHYHDHTVKQPIVYVKTHTIGHTVVHTSTQLKIQRKLFGV